MLDWNNWHKTGYWMLASTNKYLLPLLYLVK
jgi:hypothetical protein